VKVKSLLNIVDVLGLAVSDLFQCIDFFDKVFDCLVLLSIV